MPGRKKGASVYQSKLVNSKRSYPVEALLFQKGQRVLFLLKPRTTSDCFSNITTALKCKFEGLFDSPDDCDHKISHPFRNSDRHQLVQQIQMIGGGALGQQAATAVRHVAAQNGVWSLGNFGGMPPKSAMMYNQIPDGATGSSPAAGPARGPDGSQLPTMIGDGDYRFVFNSCTVGMVS